jgi:hypothetical protein
MREIFARSTLGDWTVIHPQPADPRKAFEEEVFLTFRQDSGLGVPPPTNQHQEAFSYMGLSPRLLNSFLVPVYVQKRTRVAFRDYLGKALNRPSWRDVSFHDQFKELDDLTSGFQDLDFTHLRNILQLQEKNSQEVFEAFGIKFPIETTARAGMAIILAIQLYLLMHLANTTEEDLSEPTLHGLEPTTYL